MTDDIDSREQNHFGKSRDSFRHLLDYGPPLLQIEKSHES